MTNNDKIEKLIFKDEFSKQVENFVVTKHCSYMEAILVLAEQKNLEIEYVAKMISPQIKEKLQYEAGELNMLKEKKTYLPI